MVNLWAMAYLFMQNFRPLSRLRCFSTQLPTATKDVSKQKVALVFSYLGSKFSGLQYNDNSNVKSIEETIEDSLFAVGCILPSNYKDLKKIRWSRSSRTDKGVHAARVVISCKLELKRDWFESCSNGYPQLVCLLNQKLPADIRIISCTKVAGSFQARQACFWREYEYLLPTSMLSESPAEAERRVSLLNEALQKFEGVHSFHNFHKLSTKKLLKKRQTRNEAMPVWDQTSTEQPSSDFLLDEVDDDSDEDSEGEGEGLDEGFDSMGSAEAIRAAALKFSVSPHGSRRPFTSDWKPVDRISSPRTKLSIYSCRVKSWNDSELLIRVRGQSFLLHQIRLMVGTCIQVARGILPAEILDFALTLPYYFDLPMAPAVGLLVADSGFKGSYGMEVNYHPLQMCVNKVYKSKSSLTLMTHQSYEKSEEFKKMAVYPEIQKCWAVDDYVLPSSWARYCNRYIVDDELLQQWRNMYGIAIASSSREEQHSREAHRIKESIDRLLAHPSRNSVKFRRDPKLFLPNGMSLKFITNYQIIPNEDVAYAMRVIASMMVNGVLLPHQSVDNIIEVIDRCGGLKWLLQQPYLNEFSD